MYRTNKQKRTTIQGIKTVEGESIEQKMRRILSNKEPITDGAEIIYTDRKDGVLPEYDIRTDRMEIAVEAMDIVEKSHKAKRENRQKLREDELKPKDEKDKKDGGAVPLQTTA